MAYGYASMVDFRSIGQTVLQAVVLRGRATWLMSQNATADVRQLQRIDI